MVNTLVHQVVTEDRETVETVQQLHDALDRLVGNGVVGRSLDLANTYVVELLAETLSDRSVAYSIRIREAEAA